VLGKRKLRKGVRRGSVVRHVLVLVLAMLLSAGMLWWAGSASARKAGSGTGGEGGNLPIYRNTHYSFRERAADLVSRMTLAEEVAQLHTNNAPAIPRLGVQQYTYWSEGQHGVNALGANTNPGPQLAAPHATSFPTNFASTMSWDPRLIYRETTAISDEARGFLDKSLWGVAPNNLGPSPKDYGSLTYWAPTVNMDRDPRWGRTDEAFGEDPYLASRMAGAFVDGYQGQTLGGRPKTRYLKVAATAKHYALNNVEDTRHSGSSDTTDANIRDYYTYQFKNLIQKSHVAGLMTSYNAINGTPSPADTYTTNELAQRTYGFDGYTTSDCGAIGDIYQSGSHDWAPPGWTTEQKDGQIVWTNEKTGKTVSGAAGAEAFALRAGTYLNCTGAEATLANIREAIRAGILSRGVIDEALVHLFTIRMRTGEFDPPGRVPYTKITKRVIESPAHQRLARRVADESIVLLKNADVPGTNSPLLPADPSKLSKIVIVGDLADKVTLGGYSGDPTHKVSAVQGITRALKKANPEASVTFDACGTSTTTTSPASCSPQTQQDIKNANLVVVFVGTDENVASEGHDRTSLNLPGNYSSLIDQVVSLGNRRMVLAIQSDGPVKIDNVQQSFPAIVFSGYNGESQGAALADVLFGRQNPSGHLDFTWYRDDSQLPGIENYGLTPSQTGGLGRTYMYFTGEPTYPFGYGLSYTKFRYSHVQVSPHSVSANGSVTVSFDVTNTGDRSGATVAQLYASPTFKEPGVELPKERLVGFEKTRVLRPGQTQHITLRVKASDLSLWDEKKLKEVVYDGRYLFQVGKNAENIVASRPVTVHGSIEPRVAYVTVQPDRVIFRPGQTLDLRGRNPWIKDDTDPAREERHATADNIVEAVNNDQSFVDLDKARVRYSSSDPRVATVSENGVVHTVSPGVATIRASVGGVTGSTVIYVKQPFSLKTPLVVRGGSPFSARAILKNASRKPLRDVRLSLVAPQGWDVQATSPITFGRVAPGETVRAVWRVRPPEGVGPGGYQLSARADFRSAASPDTTSVTREVSIPYSSLAAAFDNPGISDDSNPGAGNFDGGGYSYSAQSLAQVGLTPGAKVDHDGITFTWPNVPAGQPDNVVAGGQTVSVSGSGSRLGFLGASDYGDASGEGEIVYADGSTQSFTLSLPDWWANEPPEDGDILATIPYINTPGGKQDQQVSVYYASVPLRPGKEVRYVKLPDISRGVSQGQTAMHVFALGIGG